MFDRDTANTTMRPSTRWGLALCGALCLAVAAGGCKRSGPGDGDDEPGAGEAAKPGEGESASEAAERAQAVTLQLNWVPEPEFGGFYAAAHQGLYERAGLDVTIVAGGAGVPTWNMVATGKVPFAIASAGEVIRARLKDADVVALYAVYQRNPQALMVHEASGVSSLEDIFTSGRVTRVAMEAGLPYARHLEKRYGFDQVEVVQYSGNLALFLEDPKMAQQCFVFSEPVSAQLKEVPVKAFSIAESGFDPYLAVVIARGAYVEENRALVEAFVRASRAGWEAYLADPAATNEHMKSQKATMSPEAMKLAAELQTPYITSDETEAHYLGYMSAARWRALAQALVDLGEIERVPDIDALFQNLPPE